MIYELKDTIVHLFKSLAHFFRALFCKDYYTESHGLGMCGQYGRIDTNGKYRFCEYWWCPKRKSNADNAFQCVESVKSVGADRKAEPQKCETCKHYNPDHEAIACERCLDGKYSRYEPKEREGE